MIDDIIVGLHKVASELLTSATELDSKIAANQITDLSGAQRLLSTICTKLEQVHKLLGDAESPLAELVRNVDGGVLAAPLHRLGKFLDQHRAILHSLGLDGPLLDRTMTSIEAHVTKTNSDVQLNQPQSIEAKPVLQIIDEFRSLVCELSRLTDFADQVLNAAALVAVVDGVIGVAMVVVDVTGAATAGVHDPTLWVLVKAVKSTWSGVSRVRESVIRLKEAVSRLRNLRTERRQAVLRERAQNRPRLRE